VYIEITLSKRNIFLVLVAVLMVLGIGSLGGFYTYDFLRTDVIEGVYLEDLSLSKLNRDALIQRFEEYLGPRLEEPISFEANGVVGVLTAGELGYDFDYAKMADQALRAGRTGNWFLQRAARRKILKEGLLIIPQVTIDQERLERALEPLRAKTQVPPVSARWEVLPDGYQVKLIPAQAGRTIDLDQIADLVEDLLRQAPPYSLAIPFQQMHPKLDTEEAVGLGISEVVASYRTYFSPSNTSRVKNIRLAAQSINNKILLPGEVLSFNRLTGPRLPESGYEEAPIIVNGELVPGVGGGVCQVSTTLYNAAVLANLTILERNKHSLPSAYVGLGRDATVFYDYLDLKIHNETVRPVLIKSIIGHNYLDVKILGKWVYDWRIQIEVEELETIQPVWTERYDPALKPGQRVIEKEALPGRKVRVWKKYVGPEGVVSREILSTDTYQPINGVVRVGSLPKN